MAFRHLFFGIALIVASVSVGKNTAYARPPAVPKADQQRLDTPSGFPVPRFLSLKYGKTYCRGGPSFNHDIKFTFMRSGLPVLVVAETVDHWRKIRDQNGDECWMHKSTLRAQSHLLLLEKVDLFSRPDEGSHLRGVLGEGVLARLESSQKHWRRLSVGKVKGWGKPGRVWGGDPIATIGN